MQYLVVRNWERFQHYKDRNPPWIKLHFEIMTSSDWVMLADASKLLAVVCMMIASRNNGQVPNDPEYIKRVAYLEKRPNLTPLIQCGFLINPLADASESKHEQAKFRPEAETYRTDNTPPKKAGGQNTGNTMPHNILPAEWRQWAMTEKDWDELIVADVWESFREYWQEGKGKRTKRSDWSLTWRKWVRNENQKRGKQYAKQDIISGTSNKHSEVANAIREAVADHRSVSGR